MSISCFQVPTWICPFLSFPYLSFTLDKAFASYEKVNNNYERDLSQPWHCPVSVLSTVQEA